MEDILVKVGTKYRITIPTDVVEKLKIKEGDYIIFKEVNGTVIIKKAYFE